MRVSFRLGSADTGRLMQEDKVPLPLFFSDTFSIAAPAHFVELFFVLFNTGYTEFGIIPASNAPWA